MTDAKSRKKSPIWDHFVVGEDTKFVLCRICKQSVSRGGCNTKTYNTTNLVQHLKAKHSEQHVEFKKALESREEDKGKGKAALWQISLPEASERVQIWDVNNPRAQQIHQRVTEMIALDSQPFSIVEDPGFIRLVRELESRYSLPSRKYVTGKILPQIHSKVKAAVNKQLPVYVSLVLQPILGAVMMGVLLSSASRPTGLQTPLQESLLYCK